MKPLRFGIPLLAVVSVALAQGFQNQPPVTAADGTDVAVPSVPSDLIPTVVDATNTVPTNEPEPTGSDAPKEINEGGGSIQGTEVSSSVGPADTGSPAPTATATSTQTSEDSSTQTSEGSSVAVEGRSSNNNKALIGLTVLFALLFAAALAFAIFLFVKRRQDRRNGYSTAYSTPEAGVYSDKGANAPIESLRSQLADANRRLTSVQGSLLAAGQKPQTKDDNSISREYTQLGTDIVGWAGNYFKASSDPINLTTEIYEFLTEHVPNFESLLTSGKSKQLVVRAIVSQVLQESFESGAFFGNSMSAIGPLVRTSSAPAPAINNWRSETFFLLDKSDGFFAQRKAAVSTIADKVEQLTYPLAATKQSFHGDPARYKFLEEIIQEAADFALALGKQRANFQVLSEPAGCEFGYATMDDVSQQTDIITGADGTTTHPLEGRPIQATIFPLLLKYGNESGEGYDQITILSKAKVLV
ncbi:uncharacterized protein DFL_005950 [Arthrobotrys flagrans]|uniref:Uncharacterized protein n=1 Tax=Arthrobotrys flagrans TaxID=97331 RepID=A0A436ZZS9_ARTFL|nr:hypothetical protein DFL_005950 [Arthrobotrys flagrans]